jgi:GNAT superfamily N-acetyltransferase
VSCACQVRRARADEIEACADLYERVLRATFTWMAPERHRREDFLAYARHEETYVAMDGALILGIAGFYRPQNFLHSLYVEARGRGVGKALLDHVGSVATGSLSLKVQIPNRRAQAFYLREGFTPLDQGEDDGISWLRMVRRRS